MSELLFFYFRKMFSLKVIDKIYSRSFGVIVKKVKEKDEDKKIVVETLYHTDLIRNVDVDYSKENKLFIYKMSEYCESIEEGEYILKSNFEFEMCCHAHVMPGFERFIKLIIGTSGSGKTYTLAKLISRYVQAFPKQSVIYASVNDIKNEPAFKDLTAVVLGEDGKPAVDKNGKKTNEIKSIIKEINLPEVDNIIDVFSPDFEKSLVMFDDLDANTGVITYTDMDPSMTPERFKTLSIKEQMSITKSVEEKIKCVSSFMKQTAISIIFNARKQHISFCYILHAMFSGAFENTMLSEATSVVLFPNKCNKSTMNRWLRTKMLFNKKDAEYLTEKKWYKFDFLEIDKSSGQIFALMNDTLKIF